MKIKINDKLFDVTLDDNKTTKEILENLPLELNMVKYAGHEFYSELPFKPFFDKKQTSNILAGHIYYWDGWNSFVINYKDYDISPYKVVHIGEINNKSIIEILNNTDKNIKIEINK